MPRISSCLKCQAVWVGPELECPECGHDPTTAALADPPSVVNRVLADTIARGVLEVLSQKAEDRLLADTKADDEPPEEEDDPFQ